MAKPGGSQPLVELTDVSVRLGRHAVLTDCSFSVDAGEVVELGGINGSGKTTLLRVIAGVSQPTKGRRVAVASCAYVPADTGAFAIRAGEWLRLMSKRRSIDPGEFLETLGFASPLNVRIGDLSFGNVRKLLLAEAFSSTEDLVIIDEATAGLDESGVSGLAEILDISKSSGKAVVLADQASSLGFSGSTPWGIASGRLGPGRPTRVELHLEGPVEAMPDVVAEAQRYGFRRIVR